MGIHGWVSECDILVVVVFSIPLFSCLRCVCMCVYFSVVLASVCLRVCGWPCVCLCLCNCVCLCLIMYVCACECEAIIRAKHFKGKSEVEVKVNVESSLVIFASLQLTDENGIRNVFVRVAST